MRTAELRQAARGRWLEVLTAAQLPVKALAGRNGPCPMCGGRDRFRFIDRSKSGQRDGMWICTQCGSGDGFALLQAFHGWSFRDAARAVSDRIGQAPRPRPARREPSQSQLKDDMRKVWASGRKVQSLGVVDLYLMSRGIILDDCPSCIREAPNLRHSSGSTHPAMLALVRAADGTPANVHRTYLGADGRKAAVEPVRMMMRGVHPAGSAVRLATPDHRIGIAEGIETALAAAQMFGVPCWAALNAGRLAKWEPPAGVQCVTIFPDHDTNGVGQAAAAELAARLLRSGRYSVDIKMPPNPGTDWNDVLQEQP